MLGGLSSQTKSVGTKAEKSSMTAKKAGAIDGISKSEKMTVRVCIQFMRRVVALCY